MRSTSSSRSSRGGGGGGEGGLHRESKSKKHFLDLLQEENKNASQSNGLSVKETALQIFYIPVSMHSHSRVHSCVRPHKRIRKRIRSCIHSLACAGIGKVSSEPLFA